MCTESENSINSGRIWSEYDHSTGEISHKIFHFVQDVGLSNMVADGMDITKHETENRVIINLKTAVDAGKPKVAISTPLVYTKRITKAELDSLETDQDTVIEVVSDWGRFVKIDEYGEPVTDQDGRHVFNEEPALRPKYDCHWITVCYNGLYGKICVTKWICHKCSLTDLKTSSAM